MTPTLAMDGPLDELFARQTLWHAGRMPQSAGQRGGIPSGHAGLDALLPQGGWPCAALTELLMGGDGVGELALVLPALARLSAQSGPVVLVGPPYRPCPSAWRAAGVSLDDLHIVDATAGDALWAFEQCLRSGACAAVLGWPLHANGQALRRLQMAASSGQCLGFAFRDRKHAANPSPAALRMEHVPDGVGHGLWHVRKCRGGSVPAQPFALGG